MHRLRRVRSGLPGVGDLRARRPAGKVEGFHRAQRGVLRALEISDSRKRTVMPCAFAFGRFSPQRTRGITKASWLPLRPFVSLVVTLLWCKFRDAGRSSPIRCNTVGWQDVTQAKAPDPRDRRGRPVHRAPRAESPPAG